MADLKQLLSELSKKEVTRKQFLFILGGSFLGVASFFRILQSVSTPDLATSDKGVFGEKEYGHTGGKQPHKGYNSEDVFG
ncbi:MAG TPA: hypothetical protein VFT16_00305 [Candidatus Saccharimonadales bacterium]|nr:hypothetical protein [Candidatus Saccharimonadales bacterium]